MAHLCSPFLGAVYVCHTLDGQFSKAHLFNLETACSQAEALYPKDFVLWSICVETPAASSRFAQDLSSHATFSSSHDALACSRAILESPGASAIWYTCTIVAFLSLLIQGPSSSTRYPKLRFLHVSLDLYTRTEAHNTARSMKRSLPSPPLFVQVAALIAARAWPPFPGIESPLD